MVDFDIPELPLEAEAIAPLESCEITDESGGCSTYAFIGSGQAGGRIAEAFYSIGYKKTLCCNTAKQDLDGLQLPEEQKVHFDAGEEGAGKNMRAGEAAAEKGQQQVYDLMTKRFGNVDHIFICVGAGGGSGGGSTLVLLECAKKFLAYQGHDDVDSRVGVIVSLPTNGECASPSVASNAKFLVQTLAQFAEKKLISPLVIVDNDKIKRMYPSLTVKQFWPTVNGTIAGLFHIFNVIPTKKTDLTTFDAADYGSVMRAGGCMIMGVTSVKDYSSAQAVAAALKGNLEKTLLAESFDLKTATHAAAIVLGGDSVFSTAPGLMTSIEGGFDALAVMTGNAMMHRGVYSDSKDRLNVYTMIGGLAAPTKRINQLMRFNDVKGDESTRSSMPAQKFGSRLYNE